jgi:hypothetical protein
MAGVLGYFCFRAEVNDASGHGESSGEQADDLQ